MDPRPPSSESEGLDPHDFRWQALFQRAQDAVFVLNRRRRILFVNRAWENLTRLSAAEARGLVCLRGSPDPQGAWDVVIRCLCCPPAEVLQGKPGRTRRLVPGTSSAARWWDIDFLPLHDARGLLCILGRISPLPQAAARVAAPLPEKLIALRESVSQRYALDRLSSTVPHFKRVVDQVRLATQSTTPVLLVGEPGTGKHWIARCIHHQGPARERCFAALDCARLPAAVLEAVLFGPNRASRGTLYLREPASLPRDVQVRLGGLFVEGGDAEGPRLMAGCSTDPLVDMQSGRLMEGLYYLLSPLVLTLPPLRDRQADLSLLVEEFLKRAQPTGRAGEARPRVTALTPEAWEVVRAYSWPGNLRELYAVLQSACQRTATDRIDTGHLPAPVRLAVRMDETAAGVAEKPLHLDQLLEQAERRLIILALRKAQGNRSRAAELLSIWRPRLVRRMEALGIVSSQ
jgi:DNA-binding NtrC family response regulator